jgi:hypothetical protein
VPKQHNAKAAAQVGCYEVIDLREPLAEISLLEKRHVCVGGSFVAGACLFDVVQFEFDMLPL